MATPQPPPPQPGAAAAGAGAGEEKAERMKAYLEERYERLRRDREEERTRRADLEDTMVRWCLFGGGVDCALRGLSAHRPNNTQTPSEWMGSIRQP